MQTYTHNYSWKYSQTLLLFINQYFGLVTLIIIFVDLIKNIMPGCQISTQLQHYWDIFPRRPAFFPPPPFPSCSFNKEREADFIIICLLYYSYLLRIITNRGCNSQVWKWAFFISLWWSLWRVRLHHWLGPVRRAQREVDSAYCRA